jgi:hypothetical protein
MAIKHVTVALAAAWLLGGCTSFGEGVARGVLAQADRPAEDTRHV